MSEALKPLTPSELSALKAKAKAATAGPYFVAEDIADDAPAHRNSGLALVDTGRMKDWPIARLCEWKQAQFTAASNPETILRLIDLIERRDAWRPIETAPRDGTPVLVWIPKWQCYHAAFYINGGWSIPIRVTGNMGVPLPTHWQPLPAPPSEALAATEPK